MYIVKIYTGNTYKNINFTSEWAMNYFIDGVKKSPDIKAITVNEITVFER